MRMGDEQLGRRAKLDDDQVAALLKATQAYRTKHRKAMREVETGESSEPSSGGLKLVGTASGAKPGGGAGGTAAGKGRRKAE
jgi:hypothetical protein